MQYSSYLATTHWKEKRAYKLLKYPACQICGSEKGIHVHHKYYKDREGKSILFREEMGDLLTLCSSCHKLIHVYFGIGIQKINKKILRIKSLLAKGAIKNKAFWVVAQDKNLFISIAHPQGR